ncbi:MAG: tetratricopeptide repeat protein [Oligoflexales bacterium]|nr:tetratricopeptide repeat protein [Oligoflexales bacterium]
MELPKASIFGMSEQVKHIAKTIASLSLIQPEHKGDLFSEETGFHIVIACCDFSDLLSVKALKRTFLRIKSPNTLKIVYCLKPEYPRMDQLLFGHAIGAAYVSFGADKDDRLRAFIKAFLFSARKESSSLNKIEVGLKQAIANHERTKINSLYHKLNEIGKDTSLSIMRLKVDACIALGQRQKAGVFIKQILQQNGQDLWAIIRLVKLYCAKRSPESAIEAISLHSELGECGVSSSLLIGEFNCFGLLDYVEQPSIVRDFLICFAGLYTMQENHEEALIYYQYALSASSKSSTRKAKVLFKIGQIYHKQKRLSEAKEYYTESLKVGGRKYSEANKPLQSLESVPLKTNRLEKKSPIDLTKYVLWNSRYPAKKEVKAAQGLDHSHREKKMQVNAQKNKQKNHEDESLVEFEIS